MKHFTVQPEGHAIPVMPYSPAVVANGIVYVAGLVSIDEENRLVGADDIGAQTRQLLTNMSRLLEAAGSSMRSVLKTTVYLPNREHYVEMNAVYAEFFSDPLPARATLRVDLINPKYLVEIDAFALVESA